MKDILLQLLVRITGLIFLILSIVTILTWMGHELGIAKVATPRLVGYTVASVVMLVVFFALCITARRSLDRR